MGGLLGIASRGDCVEDLYFGTDYHSHLGTKRGGLCVYEKGSFKRSIHNIENAPFRTKFAGELEELQGTMGIGCISDGDPQPLTVFSKLGEYAIGTVGRINNKEALIKELFSKGSMQFMAMNDGEINNTELVAMLVSCGDSILEGIRQVQEKVEGSLTMLLLTQEGLYAARDKLGRTPMIIGKKEDAMCAASESFAFINIGYSKVKELGPGEIVLLNKDSVQTLCPPREPMRICTFLWSYFGYTTSTYEGVNVEAMRCRNGGILAKRDEENPALADVDYVAGVPDSGVAHALGYANHSRIPYSRPLIKYTPTWPRSFMLQKQKSRELIARMKLIPVFEMIADKQFVLVDDSIVRGTQLSETVSYLYNNGAKAIHVRSACPPILYGCKYLNFSRSVNDMELITRRTICELEKIRPEQVTPAILEEYINPHTEKYKKMVEAIGEKLGFTSLKFQHLEDVIQAVGIDSCKLCTYCWDGRE
jgi:amidophosphoribosyltransferase